MPSGDHAQLYPRKNDDSDWGTAQSPLPQLPPKKTSKSTNPVLGFLMNVASGLAILSGAIVLFFSLGMAAIWGAPEWDRKAAHSSAILTPIYLGFAAYLGLFILGCWLYSHFKRK